jgi:hypothetical protein
MFAQPQAPSSTSPDKIKPESLNSSGDSMIYQSETPAYSNLSNDNLSDLGGYNHQFSKISQPMYNSGVLMQQTMQSGVLVDSQQLVHQQQHQQNVFNHYQHQQHPQKNPMDSLCLMQNAYL